MANQINTQVATPPIITKQPEGVTVNVGDTIALDIVASGNTLKYQWYSNTKASTSRATAISGATGSTYTEIAKTAGTKYYYCVVTNTIGSSSAKTTSTIVKVVVLK